MTEEEWTASQDVGAMLEAIGPTLSLRKRLLFSAACCRRIAHLLADTRAANVLTLVEQFADGMIGPEKLSSVRSDIGGAVEDAFTECYYAEADANFCTHPAYSAAKATESAVYAVGSLFDQAIGELVAQERGSPVKTDRQPHEQALWAAYYNAEAFIVWAYNSQPEGKLRSPSYKVAAVFGQQVWWSEQDAQAALLREVIGPPSPPEATAWRSEAVVGLARTTEQSGEWGILPVLADALEEAGCTDARVLAHCRGAHAHVRGCWVVDAILGKT